jgi:hypothetical protein
MRIHPITGMPLEDGVGALPDDEQALVLHLPIIEQEQGKAVADAMRAKIHATEALQAAEEAEQEAHDAQQEAHHGDV